MSLCSLRSSAFIHQFIHSFDQHLLKLGTRKAKFFQDNRSWPHLPGIYSLVVKKDNVSENGKVLGQRKS